MTKEYSLRVEYHTFGYLVPDISLTCLKQINGASISIYLPNSVYLIYFFSLVRPLYYSPMTAATWQLGRSGHAIMIGIGIQNRTWQGLVI